jgi:hypothetical protein
MEDLNQLAQRANYSLTSKTGFRSCTVYGNPPEGLCYSFDTAINAENYKAERVLGDVAYKMTIRGADVFEERVKREPKIIHTQTNITPVKKWWMFWK